MVCTQQEGDKVNVILPYVAASIVGLAIVALAVVWKHRDSAYMRQGPDYLAFFLVGLVCMVIGGPFFWLVDNYCFTGLFTIGVVFFVLGMANRDKWEKKRSLSKAEIRTKLIVVIGGIIILVTGLLASLMFLMG